MFDPQMKYCQACGDEYVPDVTNCGVCGSVLYSGAEMLSAYHEKKKVFSYRKGALTTKDDVVTIFRGPLAEVKRIGALFAAENIGTRIVGEGGGCKKGCCSPDVELVIRREDGAEAQRLINADFEKMTGVSSFSHDIVDNGYDPGSEKSTCPACGFVFDTCSAACPDCGLCFG